MPTDDDLKWFKYLSKHFDDRDLRNEMFKFINK